MTFEIVKDPSGFMTKQIILLYTRAMIQMRVLLSTGKYSITMWV